MSLRRQSLESARRASRDGMGDAMKYEDRVSGLFIKVVCTKILRL